MRRLTYLALGAVAAVVAALPASPAFADGNVLTTGSLGGTAVAVGDTLTAGLASGTTATFYSTSTGTTGVTCTASGFSADVTANPAAPGVATESLTTQTFTGCTANITGVTSVKSLTVDGLPYAVSVDDSTDAVSVTGNPVQTTVVLGTLLGQVTCVYQMSGGTVTGATSNTDNSISFSGQQFTKTSGPGTCFANGFFTARYAPVVDASQGNAPVFTN